MKGGHKTEPGPDCYQRLEFFIQVLRVLCPNLTDASLVGSFLSPSSPAPLSSLSVISLGPSALHSFPSETTERSEVTSGRREMEGTRREGDDTRPKRSLFTCGPFHLHPVPLPFLPLSSPYGSDRYGRGKERGTRDEPRPCRGEPGHVGLSRLLTLASFNLPCPSSPGGLVPRAGKKGECWTFLDWRLNSENDSPVHGQPSSRSVSVSSVPRLSTFVSSRPPRHGTNPPGEVE